MYEVNNKVARYLPILILGLIMLSVIGWFMIPKVQLVHDTTEEEKPDLSDVEKESLKGVLKKGSATVPDQPVASDEWPWFRGVDGTNIVADKTLLAKKWPDTGPVKVWEKKVAKGHAGVARP